MRRVNKVGKSLQILGESLKERRNNQKIICENKYRDFAPLSIFFMFHFPLFASGFYLSLFVQTIFQIIYYSVKYYIEANQILTEYLDWLRIIPALE